MQGEASAAAFQRAAVGAVRMVQIDVTKRDITLKVVYYGPALSGKTTNLLQLHEMMSADNRSDIVTLDTQEDRTLYFDFLPVEFRAAGDFSVRLKLFTVPGQVMHKSTRKVVLAGADAVAFIADSRRSSASANAYSWRDMEANLRAHGMRIEDMPKVVQFNKRDCDDIKPPAEIKQQWDPIPTCPAVSLRGEGVLETFECLMAALYDSLNHRHDFSTKFGLARDDFLKGLLSRFQPFRGASDGLPRPD